MMIFNSTAKSHGGCVAHLGLHENLVCVLVENQCSVRKVPAIKYLRGRKRAMEETGCARAIGDSGRITSRRSRILLGRFFLGDHFCFNRLVYGTDSRAYDEKANYEGR